jgi:hypothetical protein
MTVERPSNPRRKYNANCDPVLTELSRLSEKGTSSVNDYNGYILLEWVYDLHVFVCGMFSSSHPPTKFEWFPFGRLYFSLKHNTDHHFNRHLKLKESAE